MDKQEMEQRGSVSAKGRRGATVRRSREVRVQGSRGAEEQKSCKGAEVPR